MIALPSCTLGEFSSQARQPPSSRPAEGRLLEDVFVSYLEEAAIPEQVVHVSEESRAARDQSRTGPAPSRSTPSRWFSLRRLFAYAIRESLEIGRDPIRLGFALFGTVFLMAVFGAGISTDVDNLSFAVMDRDNSPDSRAYLQELRGSRYFTEKPPIADTADLDTEIARRGYQGGHRDPTGFRQEAEERGHH